MTKTASHSLMGGPKPGRPGGAGPDSALTASSTLVKTRSVPMASSRPDRLRSWWAMAEARAMPTWTPSSPAWPSSSARASAPRVVDVGDGVGIKHEGVNGLRRRLDHLADAVDHVGGVAIPEGGVQRYTTTPGTSSVGRPASVCIQWSVPGSRPRTASRGRAANRVRWASARMAAVTTPCSIPTNTTTGQRDDGQGELDHVEAVDGTELAASGKASRPRT